MSNLIPYSRSPRILSAVESEAFIRANSHVSRLKLGGNGVVSVFFSTFADEAWLPQAETRMALEGSTKYWTQMGLEVQGWAEGPLKINFGISSAEWSRSQRRRSIVGLDEEACLSAESPFSSRLNLKSNR